MKALIGFGIRLVIALAVVAAVTSAARADALSDMKAQMQVMQQQMQVLQKQLQDMTQRMQQQQQTTERVQVQQQQQQEQLKAATPEPGHGFLEHKPGTATFYTPGGEITAYGNFDVSIEWANGKLTKAVITPHESKPLKVRYAGKEKDFSAKAGQPITVGPDL